MSTILYEIQNPLPELKDGLEAAFFTTSSFNVINPTYQQGYIGASQGYGAAFYINVSSSTGLSPTNPIEVIDGGIGFTQGQTITIPSQSLGAQAPGGTDLVITLGVKAINFNQTNFSIPNIVDGAELNIGIWDNTYFTTNSFSLPSFAGSGPFGYPAKLFGSYFVVPTGSTTQSFDNITNWGLHTQGERNAIGDTNGWGGVFRFIYTDTNPDIISLNVHKNGTGYADGDILRFQTASLGGINSGAGGTDLYITASINPYTKALLSSDKAGRPIIGSGSYFGFNDQTIFTSSLKYLSPSQVSSTTSTLPGTMSVSMQATSIWNSESADVGDEWQAYSITVNEIDLNGNYNYPTLNNNPSFSLELTDANTTSTASQNILNKNAYFLKTLQHNNASKSFRFLFGFDGDTNILNSTQTTRVNNTNSLLISFNPYINPNVISFENSDYYATLNNFNDNRYNTYLMNIEYGNGITIPSNLEPIINNTAERTQTPDSNYTMKRVTKPRYEGIKLQSVDYNFYTPPTSNITFLNGDTGSWGGDISYGKTTTINKNPIYIAHFKNSKENYELWGTYTFNIDSLIEIPSNDIKDTNIQPVVLNLNNSNNRLADVVSTFEKGRKVSVSYNRSTFEGVSYNRSTFENVDYSSIKINEKEIFQGGLEYNLVLGNEISPTNAHLTCSFITASWAIAGGIGGISDGDKVYNRSYNGYGKDFFLSTGSGFLRLDGGFYYVSQSYQSGTQVIAESYGPGLGLIHTLNVAVSMSNFISFPTSSGTDTGSLGIPRNTGLKSEINPELNENYWVPFYSGSSMANYEDFSIPFIVKRGDEIRISWKSTDSTPITFNQDFTVTNVTTRGLTTSSIGSDYLNAIFNSNLYFHSVYENSVYDKLEVTPDPTTFGIPNGQIDNFTIRRRVETDNRVIVYQNAPNNSQGFRTLSGQGILIPNDLTPIQKSNVQIIMNKLTEQNQYTEQSDIDRSLTSPSSSL